MFKQLCVLSLLLWAFACDQTTETRELSLNIAVVPHPKELQPSSQSLILSSQSMLYTAEKRLQPLLQLFQHELAQLTGKDVAISPEKDQSADIVFQIDPTLPEENYHLDITETIEVRGGSYQALAMAKNSLLQLVSQEGQSLVFPKVQIRDFPDASYRGLMIDVARKWHEISTLEKLIDLAAFYKLNYVQIHFTDYQSYTLPSKSYPNLSTEGRHYTRQELMALEAYAQVRGVTLIPELEVPGHSSQFVKKYPEIFAIKDTAENPWIINMGKEEVYEALDLLLGELAEIFTATPYFHIGGDEAIFTKVMDDPAVQQYIAQQGIDNDAHELYRHFLVRMNELVKKHGKQMCIWEGFRPTGKIAIPKDILVFEFETNRYLPDQLLEDGYPVVNTSWKPLYVVNQKKWAPETIYKWNIGLWQNWWSKAPSINPIQTSPSDLVIGAQMCSWEQAEILEIPSLRKRVSPFAERVWNREKKIPFESFKKLMEATDEKLSLLIQDKRQDSLLYGYDFSAELLED